MGVRVVGDLKPSVFLFLSGLRAVAHLARVRWCGAPQFILKDFFSFRFLKSKKEKTGMAHLVLQQGLQGREAAAGAEGGGRGAPPAPQARQGGSSPTGLGEGGRGAAGLETLGAWPHGRGACACSALRRRGREGKHAEARPQHVRGGMHAEAGALQWGQGF